MFVLQKIVSKINNNKLLNLSLLFSLIITISFVTFSLFSLSLVNEVKADSNIICPLANTNQDLFLGSINEDVRNLQKFLNNSGFILAQTGPGSIGRETNYFGYLTRAALTRFQTEKNISDVNLGALDFNTRKYLNCQSEYEFDFDPKQDLIFTSVSEDVRKLQRFLNNSGFILAQTGPGSFGRETNYFGVLTRAALTRFQALNKVAVNDFGSLELNTRKFISDLKDKVIEEIKELDTEEENDLKEDPTLPNNNISKVYSLRGRITGLQDDIILLNKINNDELFIKVDDFSAFSFSKKLASGEKYEIIIKSKTTDVIDNQNCFVKKPIGFVEDKDITNLEVMCGDVMTLVNNPFDYVPTSGGGSDTQTYTLTYSSGSNGSIMGTSPQTIAENSNGSAVSAVPDTGYSFVSWSDGVTSSTRVDSSVSANVNVTANFAINTYTINYSAETGGSVSGTLSQTVDYNSSTTQVEAIPNPGYTFISWSDDVTSSTRVDSSINSNATYTASFGIINISSPLENAELNLDTDFTISGTSSLNISSVIIEASNNSGTSWIQIATTTSNGNWSATVQLSSCIFSIGDNIVIKVSSGVVEKEVNVLIENNISVSFFEKANIGGSTLAAIFDGRVYSWGGNPTIMGNSRVRTNSPVPFNVDTSGVLNNKNIVQLSGKNSHSLALDEDGNVYTWGFNTSGQLGNGNTTNSAIPILVNIPNSGKKIVQVSAGNQHSLALDEDGNLYSWGANSFGQLGDGSTSQKTTPVLVNTSTFAGNKIIQVSAGSHSLALDEYENTYAWGANSYGQLGDGSTSQKTTPVLVNTSTFAGNKIVQVSAGSGHSLALDENGNVYAWGENLNGKLGDGSTDQRTIPVLVNTSTFAGNKIIYVGAGVVNSLVIDEFDHVYTWGRNTSGGVGIGSYESMFTTPKKVYNYGVLYPKSIFKISASYDYSLALDTNGQIYSWGYYESLGIDVHNNQDRHFPVEVNTSTFINNIVDIDVGLAHSLALDENGNVYSWGANSFGQLGDGSTSQKNTPVLVNTSTFAGNKIIQISASSFHSLALDENGNIYSWGRNNNGQLGDGSTSQKTTPVLVNTSTFAGNKIIQISAGGFDKDGFSLALDLNGNVYSWGYNSSGQLGDGSTSQKTTPVLVNSSTFTGNKIIQISAGGSHSLALDEYENTYAWGANSYGQLGDGSTSQKTTPVLVNTSTFAGNKIVQVSAGGSHSLLLDQEGSVFACGGGYYYYGQLGDGLGDVWTTRKQNIAVKVDTSGVLADKQIINISAGYYHSLVFDENNDVYAWGFNSFGQLGTNISEEYLYSPALVYRKP